MKPKQRKCIDFSKVTEESLSFVNEQDFVRVYTNDNKLICIKNLSLEVVNIKTLKMSRAPVPTKLTDWVVADVTTMIEDKLTTDTIVRLEGVLKELSYKFCQDDKFPLIEDRVLIYRLTRDGKFKARFKFLHSEEFTPLMNTISNEDIINTKIALLGLKLFKGEIFPVWRVMSMDVVKSQTNDLDDSLNTGLVDVDDLKDDEIKEDQVPITINSKNEEIINHLGQVPSTIIDNIKSDVANEYHGDINNKQEARLSTAKNAKKVQTELIKDIQNKLNTLYELSLPSQV